MSLLTNLIKKALKDFFHKWKKWLIICSFLLLLFIGLNLIATHYVKNVVGTLVKEFVHEKSNGFYQIDFEEIGYILNNGRFLITEFKFDIHPDHQNNLQFEGLEQNYLYTAIIPRLHIDIIEFWSIFINKQLRVIGIEIDNPFIKIINLNKNKAPKKISFEAGNLYEVLSGHLNELKINNFLIKNGEFDYETYDGPDYDNFKVKGVTFEVKNFQVNEKAQTRTDKFFYTDDISLEVKDQVLFLKDSIHKITFDRFYISTLRNELGFENFKLTRRVTPLTNLQTHNHYEISLPQLRLAGIDFLSAYNNNLLRIDSIQINRPTVDLKKRTQAHEGTDSTKNNLLDIAMLYNDYMTVDHFSLDDAQLIFTDETKILPKTYKIDHISAMLSEVKFDTTKNSKINYGIDFNNVELVVKDYEVILPDSVNSIKFDEFSITSDPYKITLKDLIMQPDQSAVLSEEKNLLFAKLPYLVITEFDISKAINKDTFLIDEVYLEHPEFKLIPAGSKKTNDQKSNPGGMFGFYKVLQSFSELFVVKKIKVQNGIFNIENPINSENQLELNNIDLAVNNIHVDSQTDIDHDLFGNADVRISLNNSSVKLDPGWMKFRNLLFTSSNGRLGIDSLTFTSDSTKNQAHNIFVELPQLLISGLNTNKLLFERHIELDSLKLEDVNIQINLEGNPASKSKSPAKKDNNFPIVNIAHLIGTNYRMNFYIDGLPVFSYDDLDIHISKLLLDQSLSENPINQFDFEKINYLSIKNYELFLNKQHHFFQTQQILWNHDNSTFSMENIRLKPYGKPNNLYDIRVPAIIMNGIDLKEILKESYYNGNEIIINEPEINLKLAKGHQEKLGNLDLGFIPLLLRNRYLGARANDFQIKNASINVHQKAEQDSTLIEVQNLNLIIDNFEVDSTTEMLPNRFLFSNDVRLQGDYLSVYNQAKSDFYNINHINISTKDGDIQLNGLYLATDTKNQNLDKDKINLTADNILINDFNFFNLTQNRKVDIAEIHIDDAQFHLIPGLKDEKEVTILENMNNPNDTTLIEKLSEKLQRQMSVITEMDRNALNQKVTEDSMLHSEISKTLSGIFVKPKPIEKKKSFKIEQKSYPFDTLLLKSIDIGRILITDSQVKIDNPEEVNKGLVLPEIWLLSEGVKYDPISSTDTTRLFYSDHLMAKLSNIKYILPDNLSSIQVDDLTLDSRDSTIKAGNFALIPLVARYDYGPAKGYQSTWLQIENDSIILKNVDFLGFINHGAFNAQSLNVHKLDVSIFRDKRVPFPEWQRKPLPQTSLRDMNFAIGLDTILLHDGYITYQEHAEKAYTTGEVFFSDLNATILNLTNDSIRTQSYPNTRIGATGKLFGKGNIKAEFLFNLVDMENIHSYGIEVDAFDLTEFNRMMVPAASVQISSGKNEKIIMTARANEDYSYGEMKFYYEDLKITLLNRETETPKGIGNVLGSFFANTFIIKSNNPNNLILRKGDIFFERDKKRAIFNYWTKTFLSGVVSSIGAVNNKKKIKQMQEENLKQIKAHKELEAKL